MAVLTTLEIRRVANFAEKKQWRCLNCGKEIENATGLYSRRFCSDKCKGTFFSTSLI